MSVGEQPVGEQSVGGQSVSQAGAGRDGRDAGVPVSSSDTQTLKRAVRNAEAASGLKFSLYLGRADGEPRRHAIRLHDALESSEDAVLVLCDPFVKALEIVTGHRARRSLDDNECKLAAAAMQSSFAAGDIVGGLSHGLQQLGSAARAPETLHFREKLG